MTTFSIAKWFHIEADSYEEAWMIADGDPVELVEARLDSGTIDVEEVEE